MNKKFEEVISNLDKSKRYLLACSFGPDSMCLMGLLLKAKADFVVAHVNYQRRKEAHEEAKNLREFCDANRIPFYQKNVKYQGRYGNFQSWAREKRYSFFNELSQRLSLDALLVAHQEDDLIETFLIQKERGASVFYYGLQSNTRILDMLVLRPLLGMTKRETQEFCEENNIPFAIDQSNFSKRYTRNRIRIDVLTDMTSSMRKTIISEIEHKNEQLILEKEKLDKRFGSYEIIDVSEVQGLSEIGKYYVLYKLVTRFLPPRKFDSQLFKNLLKCLASKQPNKTLHLTRRLAVVKEYGTLCVVDFAKIKPYSVQIRYPQVVNETYFRATLSYEMPKRGIQKSDWPLTIRSPKSEDVYSIKDYKVQLRRLFIDWKMPSTIRKIWPIVLNSKGEIIYIPRYKGTYRQDPNSDFEVILPYLSKD